MVMTDTPRGPPSQGQLLALIPNEGAAGVGDTVVKFLKEFGVVGLPESGRENPFLRLPPSPWGLGRTTALGAQAGPLPLPRQPGLGGAPVLLTPPLPSCSGLRPPDPQPGVAGGELEPCWHCFEVHIHVALCRGSPVPQSFCRSRSD